MSAMQIYLVKPHPPQEVLERRTPLPERYRYAWNPIVLKLLARSLADHFGESIDCQVWHLLHHEDDRLFLDSVTQDRPALILFTEIDLLVNEVSRLATAARSLSPQSLLVVGGKQSSLLLPGDRFPFEGIDYAIRGDGPTAIINLVEQLLAGERHFTLPGAITAADIVDDNGDYSPRSKAEPDHISIQSIPVVNHSMEEYLTLHQHQPSILAGKLRTAPIYTGTGCPYSCFFCQSPIEYGKAGLRKAILSPVREVAREMAWLMAMHDVNHFFSMEPNLNLTNLDQIYHELQTMGIDYAAVSGFVRAGDIRRFHLKGLLAKLAARGLRVLSIGLDIPLDGKEDLYNKSFSYQEMLESLQICEDLGIIVFATMVGDPTLSAVEFARQLDYVGGLAIAEMDVRLAIALRHTNYYKAMETNLIYHPDHHRRYFDRQNYRYQTIAVPGAIREEETYELAGEFFADFQEDPRHRAYVERMVARHPDTLPLFERLAANPLHHSTRLVAAGAEVTH